MLTDTTILEMIRSHAARCGDQEPASIHYLRGSRGPSPTGTWNAITMVINDETGRVTDSGFRQRPNDLSKFGTVVDLTVPQ